MSELFLRNFYDKKVSFNTYYIIYNCSSKVFTAASTNRFKRVLIQRRFYWKSKKSHENSLRKKQLKILILH